MEDPVNQVTDSDINPDLDMVLRPAVKHEPVDVPEDVQETIEDKKCVEIKEIQIQWLYMVKKKECEQHDTSSKVKNGNHNSGVTAMGSNSDVIYNIKNEPGPDASSGNSFQFQLEKHFANYEEPIDSKAEPDVATENRADKKRIKQELNVGKEMPHSMEQSAISCNEQVLDVKQESGTQSELTDVNQELVKSQFGPHERSPDEVLNQVSSLLFKASQIGTVLSQQKPRSIKQHTKTHTEEKPYSCDMCQYKCKTASNLKHHKMTHTGERPYSCHECDFTTRWPTHLNLHIMKHKGEKPLLCDVCDYATNQHSVLKRHMLTHKGKKPYSCDVCPYKCKRPAHLRVHKLIHNTEKPYECELCSYSSKTPQGLKKHQKKHH